ELRLEGFDADRQILERLVSAGAGIRGERLEEFLEAVASDRPTPGGGAVAAALVEMVSNLTAGRSGYEQTWDRMREVATAASRARAEFLALADRDTAAFDRVMGAFGLPKETDEQRAERSRAIREAYREAAEAPLEVARRAVDLMEAAAECVRVGNVNAASDALSAVHELSASVGCAIANVEINLAGMKDEAAAARMRSEIGAIRARAREWSETAELVFATRVG